MAARSSSLKQERRGSPARTAKSRTSNDLELKLKNANIMFDPRVVRGNTWAASTLTKLRQTATPPSKPTQPSKKKVATKPATQLVTPRPIDGRQHFEQQTEDFLEDTLEDSNCTQTEPEVSEQSIPAYAGMQSSDAGTQIETGDLPDAEAQAQAKANQEASYWATVEEEHQQAMQRQLAILQVQQQELKRQQAKYEEHERQHEAEQAERRRQEDQDRLYVQEQLCYKGACQLAADALGIATQALYTGYVHQDADISAIEVAQGLSGRTPRFDLDSLMYAAQRDMRTFSIRESPTFEAMLTAMANGADVPEEEIQQVIRRQTG